MPELDNSTSIVPLIIGILIMGSISFAVFKFRYNRRRISQLSRDDLRFDDIRSVYNKLKKGETPKQNDVHKFAKSVEYRALVYEALYIHDKAHLFPSEYKSRELFGESYLANWLNYHDEFDALPDEIEYLETIQLEGGSLIMIYKFKVYEPHLMTSKGWMIGYVSYDNLNEIDPLETPDLFFSEFNDEPMSEDQLKTTFSPFSIFE